MLIIEIALGVVLGVLALALLPALLAVAIRVVPWAIGCLVLAFLLVKALQLSWADWKLGFEVIGCGVVFCIAMLWLVPVVKRHEARAAARKPSGWRWERGMKREEKRRAALGYGE